ncbi:MFS transporter [Mucilaginibacter lappiensis]|uniref:MFS family arabinose efflux permease n=1 Tax=Mucilaginibacter lappiensis TaxID=354630 RepID=A0A1N6UH39_9SPHI|nr:MFS transporter [Mucilaginibacter lappiensis]MBB6108851.1 putative MFS family arabinose efflux permease [Mucilaginibacter lappiensis]MBB6130444.1 putative MFS family arabinose efflux permease [Mucilaginibacter lappiensis]SIQ64924.1 Predicted arabinose efflux permease, MFS family [Mucilaginibacter lappiensis]
MDNQQPVAFTGYQKLIIFLLAITQFTVILDFMVMSPLGDILMKSLNLKPSAFGIAVSAYAFSAGISGLLTAGFADKFDRKKLLLFFYLGFIAGTVFCGLAQSYAVLVAARIITGLFGGVIGSISMAIITDLFTLQQRGRVMGFVQMGFGASQVLGIPIGLYLANALGWKAPFWMVALLSISIAILIAIKMKPVIAHLLIKTEKTAFKHLLHTVTKSNYRVGFAATGLLSIGGFMMMPFGSAFAINNLGLTNGQLPILFMVSGLSSLAIMPLVGKLSDKISKFKIFAIATVWMMFMCVLYTNLGVTAFPMVIFYNILMMMGVMSRMIPSSALTSAIPDMADRGAFMSINSSLQQIAGGVAAAVAGMIVTQPGKGAPLQHYNIVGYVIVAISIISILLMRRVDNLTKKKAENGKSIIPDDVVILEG